METTYAEDETRRTWSVRKNGWGVHFWCQPSSDSGLYGGVELHMPSGEGEPDNEHCWLLRGPCWHDGSSLMASERFIPMVERGESHGAIFRAVADVLEANMTKG